MIRKRKILILIAIVAWLIIFAGIGVQLSAQHALDWFVISGGGQKMESASYNMNGTTGQSVIGLAQAANHAISSGFWYVRHPVVEIQQLYLPLIVR
jgi:hypothetical protein